jgi:alpha-amylase/alpha-mannosidase (GH57 family)
MPGTILFGIDVESASEESAGFARFGAELFRDLGVPVTWYLTGKTLDLYPDIFREIEAGDGIELQAHTYSHILLKTVLIQVPEGCTVHEKTDWHLERAGTLDEIDADLERCQRVCQKILGRRPTGLTTPWGYYRGLADRLDLLEIVDRHGFKILRSFARNERDGNPVPLEWQPFFYEVQGFPHILECMVQDYQDDFYWEAFARPAEGELYADHLRTVAQKVADEDLVWSIASHDHHCATREGFNRKGDWYRALIEHALGLNIRFLTATQYYNEKLSQRQDP